MRFFAFECGFAVLAAMAPVLAKASSLPQATASMYVNAGPMAERIDNTVGGYDYAHYHDVYGDANARVSNGISGRPFLKVEGSIDGPLSFFYTQENGYLSYYFEVFGPSNTNVSVNVSANGYVFGNGGGTFQVIDSGNHQYIDASFASGEVTAYTPNVNPLNNVLGSFDIEQKFDFLSDEVYKVVLTGYGTTGTSSKNSLVYVDPIFTIDPAYTAQYSLAFSNGVGNVSAVPLPASAPMFGAALLALAGFSFGMNRWVAPKGKKVAARA